MAAKKIKHLEFIQNIITRMNSNSFMIKGWSITITSAIIAIYASTSNIKFLLIALIPLFLFWFLDAFYLRQERLFRCLYKESIKEKSKIERFDLSIPKHCMDNKNNSYCNVFFSRTIALLYFPLIIIIIIGYSYLGVTKTTLINKFPETLNIELSDTLIINNISTKVNLELNKNIISISDSSNVDILQKK